MKKTIYTLAAWFMYYVGDALSKPLCWSWTGEFGVRVFHPPYCWFMQQSYDLQKAVGAKGPWGEAEAYLPDDEDADAVK